MRVIPIYGKFYISGEKIKNGKLNFLCVKKTLSRALRYAHKKEKKGWYEIYIMDDESCNMIYCTSWHKERR